MIFKLNDLSFYQVYYYYIYITTIYKKKKNNTLNTRSWIKKLQGGNSQLD